MNNNDNYYKDTTTTARMQSRYDVDYWAGSFGQRGWICPKCGRVNAPWAMTCLCSETKTHAIAWATTGVPSTCAQCKNNPNNGGSGICHCILGTITIY